MPSAKTPNGAPEGARVRKGAQEWKTVAPTGAPLPFARGRRGNEAAEPSDQDDGPAEAEEDA